MFAPKSMLELLMPEEEYNDYKDNRLQEIKSQLETFGYDAEVIGIALKNVTNKYDINEITNYIEDYMQQHNMVKYICLSCSFHTTIFKQYTILSVTEL